jgi:RNA polymerase sigma factor (sigma-70 family)
MIRVPEHVTRELRALQADPALVTGARAKVLCAVPREPLRLEQRVGGADSEQSLGDTVRDGGRSALDELLLSEAETRMADLLSCLTSREREVLRRRFGMGDIAEEETLAEIGDRLGVTRERVRQIERAALDKLRQQRRALARELLDVDGDGLDPSR